MIMDELRFNMGAIVTDNQRFRMNLLDNVVRDEDDLEEEYSEDEALVGLFKGKSRPDYKIAWEMYNKGLAFNVQINLDETVKVNENLRFTKQKSCVRI